MRFLLVLLLSLSGCALLKQKKIIEPKLKLENVRLDSANLEGAQLIFEVHVDNPNAFPLELDSVDYDLQFEGKPVGTGQVSKNLRVEKNSSTVINLPVQIKLKNLMKSVGSLLGQGTTPYHITGKAKLGLLSLPFDESGDLRFEDGKVKKVKAKKKD